MVSIKQQHFRSCEIQTITGAPVDCKIVMACLVTQRHGIVLKRIISDKNAEIVIEIPKTVR